MIRAYIIEQWRVRFIEEERRQMENPFDYVTIGANVAKSMADHNDEIEQEIIEAIEAAKERASWR